MNGYCRTVSEYYTEKGGGTVYGLEFVRFSGGKYYVLRRAVALTASLRLISWYVLMANRGNLPGVHFDQLADMIRRDTRTGARPDLRYYKEHDRIHWNWPYDIKEQRHIQPDEELE